MQNINRALEINTENRHYIGDDVSALAQVQAPNVDLGLWRRPFQTAIAEEVSSLSAGSLNDRKRRIPIEHFDQRIAETLQLHGLNQGQYVNLRQDLSYLSRVFASIVGTSELVFRLFTTGEDDCRRFHLDRLKMRLMCTYQGPGTQWLSEAQLDRVAQHTGQANEDIIRFGNPQRFEPFWVGIMRGDPTNQGVGLVHRSPPVVDTGEIRVVFCLDA